MSYYICAVFDLHYIYNVLNLIQKIKAQCCTNLDISFVLQTITVLVTWHCMSHKIGGYDRCLVV